METRKSNELQIGKAGEYLVCSDLIRKGLIAFPSEQGLPYDIVIDTGKKLLKCQVKTTVKPREVSQRNKKTYAYIFNVFRHGKNNSKRYDKHEVDIFALCALDTNQVGYLLNEDMPSTLNIRVDRFKGTYYDEKGIKDYEKVKKYIESGLSQSEAAREINIGVSTVNRMCAKGYEPYKTQAKYFSDLLKNREWFLCL